MRLVVVDRAEQAADRRRPEPEPGHLDIRSGRSARSRTGRRASAVLLSGQRRLPLTEPSATRYRSLHRPPASILNSRGSVAVKSFPHQRAHRRSAPDDRLPARTCASWPAHDRRQRALPRHRRARLHRRVDGPRRSSATARPSSAFDLGTDARRLRLIMTPDELAGVTFVAGDITDLAPVERVLDGHATSPTSSTWPRSQVPFCRADPPRGALVNVVGTVNVFEAVRRRADADGAGRLHELDGRLHRRRRRPASPAA